MSNIISSDEELLYEKAVHLYKIEDFKGAYEEFNNLLNKNLVLEKVYPEIYSYLSICLFKMEECEKSMVFFKKQLNFINNISSHNIDSNFYSLFLDSFLNIIEISSDFYNLKMLNKLLNIALIKLNRSIFENEKNKIEQIFSFFQIRSCISPALEKKFEKEYLKKEQIFKNFSSLNKFYHHYHFALTFETSWNIEIIDSYVNHVESINFFLKNYLDYTEIDDSDHKDFFAFSKLLPNLILTYKYGTFEIILKEISQKIKQIFNIEVKVSGIPFNEVAKNFEEINPNRKIKFSEKDITLISELKSIRNKIIHEGPQYEQEYTFMNLCADEEIGYCYTHPLLSFIDTIGLILISFDSDEFSNKFIK